MLTKDARIDESSLPAPDAPRRMLDIDQVLAIVPISESTLFRMVRNRQFPPSHMISTKRCAWYEDEVIAWQRTLPINDRIIRRAEMRKAAASGSTQMAHDRGKANASMGKRTRKARKRDGQ